MQVLDLRIVILLVTLNRYTSGSEFQDYSAFADETLQDHAFFEPGDYITSYSSLEGPSNSKKLEPQISLTVAPLPEEKRVEDGGGAQEQNTEPEVLENSNSKYRLRFVPSSAEVTSEKHLVNEMSKIHPNDYGKSYLNEEMGSNLPPMRRETNNWQLAEDILENDMPWGFHNYEALPISQSEYLDYGDRTNFDDQQNGSFKGFRETGPSVDLPQYFQKNYYYNYYSAPNIRKYGAPMKRNKGGGLNAGEGDGRTFLNGKQSGRSACKQYLQFLKYAFEKLDESSEHQYDYVDDYDVNSPPKSKPGRVVTTQLMGPMLYVDNSGRVSNVNTKVGPVSYSFPPSRLLVQTEPSAKFTTQTPKTPPTFGKFFNSPATTTSAPTTEDESTTPPYSYTDETTEETSEPPEEESTVDSVTNVLPPFQSFFMPHKHKEKFDDEDWSVTQRRLTTEPWRDSTTPSWKSHVSENTIFSSTIVDLWAKLRWKLSSSAGDNKSGSADSTTPTILEAVRPRSFENQNRDGLGLELTFDEFEPNYPKSKTVDCNDKMLPCPDTFNLTYPLNGYCNRYVSCESGRAIRRICPEGLHFNIITKSCDIPHNSFCTYACPRPNGYFGVPGDCGGYFVCKNSVAQYRMCPPKMHWDIRKGLCDFEESSACPMTCSRNNEVKPYSGDCKAYVICLNGIPYYHKCPPQMKFDRKVLTCVPEHLSMCENDPRLLTKTLNPNKMCRDIQLKLGSRAWCSYFDPTGAME